MDKICYQSYSWVVGTTSFRNAKLNLKIEQQLSILDNFHKTISKKDKWTWNKDLQEKYYNFMKDAKFINGDAKRKDKDARQKTSSLESIGLITKDREITEVGYELLSIIENQNFNKDNIFNIDNDSYVYLKQLLKKTLNVNRKLVRPFLVVLKCLKELDVLSYDEFTYFIPLITDYDNYKDIIDKIKLYRENKVKREDVIYERLTSMSNYKEALEEFINNKVDEDLICLIAFNRKSREGDIPYYKLYEEIKHIFLDNLDNYEELLNAIDKVSKKPGRLWKSLIFKTINKKDIRENGKETISKTCPFLICSNEKELKEVFFKYLHVFKAMANLSEYFDLNRRYFNITDIMLFEDGNIKLDMFPKYYFKEIIDVLFEEAFTACDNLTSSTSLYEISEAFNFDVAKVYSLLSKKLGIQIETPEEASKIINDERHKRFNLLIDEKFSDSILIELLGHFKTRNDKKIEELVTDEAEIFTIFEYILGIIWYKISERQGNILDFMKLSLEANLLPKSHAAGGGADIIYEYEKCSDYPKHSLLLEATLSSRNNQRRMEMEPVSRHLGDYIIHNDNEFDYSLFVSTEIHTQVRTDFTFRKIMPYTKGDKTINGLKIISISTDPLKKIIRNKTKYKDLYTIFNKYHETPLEQNYDDETYINMINEATKEYEG